MPKKDFVHRIFAVDKHGESANIKKHKNLGVI
jgi:hypothetical protein